VVLKVPGKPGRRRDVVLVLLRMTEFRSQRPQKFGMIEVVISKVCLVLICRAKREREARSHQPRVLSIETVPIPLPRDALIEGGRLNLVTNPRHSRDERDLEDVG